METLSFIIDYFDEQTYVDGIYLFGTSQGGLVSSVVADEKEASNWNYTQCDRDYNAYFFTYESVWSVELLLNDPNNKIKKAD